MFASVSVYLYFFRFVHLPRLHWLQNGFWYLAYNHVDDWSHEDAQNAMAFVIIMMRWTDNEMVRMRINDSSLNSETNTKYPFHHISMNAQPLYLDSSMLEPFQFRKNSGRSQTIRNQFWEGKNGLHGKKKVNMIWAQNLFLAGIG